MNGLIFAENQDILEEIQSAFANISELSCKYYKSISGNRKKLENEYFDFLIIATNNPKELNIFSELVADFPQVYFIYYFPTLNLEYNQHQDFTKFHQVIVGENRQVNLVRIVEKIIQNHWKKIPLNLIVKNRHKISDRIKNIINYIESHDLKECTSARISAHLHLSPGYFSQEFRKETGQTFRDFMQNLRAHYEKIILEKMKLNAKTASQILGYSELSSFSRSFKKRKGYSPSQKKSDLPNITI